MHLIWTLFFRYLLLMRISCELTNEMEFLSKSFGGKQTLNRRISATIETIWLQPISCIRISSLVRRSCNLETKRSKLILINRTKMTRAISIKNFSSGRFSKGMPLSGCQKACYATYQSTWNRCSGRRIILNRWEYTLISSSIVQKDWSQQVLISSDNSF